MWNSSNQRRTIQEILDSDDELTTNFVETPYIPSYKDDARFDWCDDSNKVLKNVVVNKNRFENMQHLDHGQSKVMKGYLNIKDTYCLQAVQKIPNDILPWLFEYLMYKDIHTNYSFLRPCLVSNYIDDYAKSSASLSFTCKEKQRLRYKIVINK